jgi:hypothetical protein
MRLRPALQWEGMEVQLSISLNDFKVASHSSAATQNRKRLEPISAPLKRRCRSRLVAIVDKLDTYIPPDPHTAPPPLLRALQSSTVRTSKQPTLTPTVGQGLEHLVSQHHSLGSLHRQLSFEDLQWPTPTYVARTVQNTHQPFVSGLAPAARNELARTFLRFLGRPAGEHPCLQQTAVFSDPRLVKLLPTLPVLWSIIMHAKHSFCWFSRTCRLPGST